MVDKDLLSRQEARSLVRGARTAQARLAEMNQEQVNALTEAIAAAAKARAGDLAKKAVEETGFGRWQDKEAKNLLASETLIARIRELKTVGIIREDNERQIWEIATPAGVIAGLIPSTNPTSTVIYKAIIAIKAGNAIVFAPHPSALQCIRATVEMIRECLEAKGAPADLVSLITLPTVQGTEELMRQVDLILATGGPGMVRAAYSSGTPAIGVGAGNVPVYIERSADIGAAVDKIFRSKTFDNGTVCASEQAIITERVIVREVKEALIARGGYFLEGENLRKIKRIMERPDGGMNPAIVGRDASTVAALAGITLPSGVRVMIAEEEGIGPEYPFSKEKLTSLLGFYTVEDWHQACEYCFRLLENGGIGHSLAIHSRNTEVIRQFALKKPVSRLLVNTPSTHGAVGISTGLPPALTLGCGTVGGSSTSDNVGPEHLFNIRRVAFDLTSEPSREQLLLDVDIQRITEIVLRQLKESRV